MEEKQNEELYICPSCGGELKYSEDLKEVKCKVETCNFGKQRLILVQN